MDPKKVYMRSTDKYIVINILYRERERGRKIERERERDVWTTMFRTACVKKKGYQLHYAYASQFWIIHPIALVLHMGSSFVIKTGIVVVQLQFQGRMQRNRKQIHQSCRCAPRIDLLTSCTNYLVTFQRCLETLSVIYLLLHSSLGPNVVSEALEPHI